MELKSIGPNQTEIRSNGNTIFFSYNTPVAGIVDGEFCKTSKKWSMTTSRHINKWLDGASAKEMPQSFFDNLA